MRSLAVASRPRPSETEWIVRNYSWLHRSISRAARSVDHTDPSIAMRKHCIVRKIPRFPKVNVNKVDIFYGIVLILLACCFFRCKLSLYWQCIYVQSVTAAQGELNEARIWHTHTHARTHARMHAHTHTYIQIAEPSHDILKFIYIDSWVKWSCCITSKLWVFSPLRARRMKSVWCYFDDVMPRNVA